MDQAQGLRELAAKIWEGGNEVEGAHGRLVGDEGGGPLKPYSRTSDRPWSETSQGAMGRLEPYTGERELRAALVNLLAADRRLAFAASTSDPGATLLAQEFQRKAMEAADQVLTQF